jgi:uncharacterized protein
MIARILRAFAGAAALLAAAAAFAQQIPVPKLTGHVVDLTGTLAASDKSALDAKLVSFEKERGAQVVVLVVPSIGDETIEEFAGRVTDDWKIGRKGIDDGVLFVVAMHERRLRIAPGRGVSGSLTDALSKRIVSDIVAPHFKQGDFAGGLDAGSDAIMKAVAGESLPLPAQRPQARTGKSSGSISNLFWIAFFVVPIAGLVLRSVFGRFFGATLTSGLTAFFAWFALGSVAIVVIAAIAAFLFTLLSGTGITRGVSSGGWGGGGFGGGGFTGGGFSGGGGGGGFSGGGGGFDGGGASGSW